MELASVGEVYLCPDSGRGVKNLSKIFVVGAGYESGQYLDFRLPLIIEVEISATDSHHWLHLYPGLYTAAI